jgi:hypothetical protein
MNELWTYHGASTIMSKTLDWNRSRISMQICNNSGFIEHYDLHDHNSEIRKMQ